MNLDDLIGSLQTAPEDLGAVHRVKRSRLLGSWEEERNISYPDDYRACLMRYAGVHFDDAVVSYGVGGRNRLVLPDFLLGFGDEGAFGRGTLTSTVQWAWRELPVVLEESGFGLSELDRVVPFAGSASWGWLCFDFANDDAPCIVHFDTDKPWKKIGDKTTGLSYVASSFSDFLSMLEYPDEFGNTPTLVGSSRVATDQERSWELGLSARLRWSDR